MGRKVIPIMRTRATVNTRNSRSRRKVRTPRTDHGKPNVPRSTNWRSTSTECLSALELRTERSTGGVRSVVQTEDGLPLITLRNMTQTSSFPTKVMENIVVRPTSEKVSLPSAICGQQESTWTLSSSLDNQAGVSRANDASFSRANDLESDSTTRANGFIEDNDDSISWRHWTSEISSPSGEATHLSTRDQRPRAQTVKLAIVHGSTSSS